MFQNITTKTDDQTRKLLSFGSKSTMLYSKVIHTMRKNEKRNLKFEGRDNRLGIDNEKSRYNKTPISRIQLVYFCIMLPCCLLKKLQSMMHGLKNM